MSRAGASVGAFVGALIGGVGGVMTGAYVFKHDPDEPSDDVYYRKSSDVNLAGALGTVAGATVGAAVGAGSSKPKQVAGVSGVGELTPNGSFP